MRRRQGGAKAEYLLVVALVATVAVMAVAWFGRSVIRPWAQGPFGGGGSTSPPESGVPVPASNHAAPSAGGAGGASPTDSEDDLPLDPNWLLGSDAPSGNQPGADGVSGPSSKEMVDRFQAVKVGFFDGPEADRARARRKHEDASRLRERAHLCGSFALDPATPPAALAVLREQAQWELDQANRLDGEAKRLEDRAAEEEERRKLEELVRKDPRAEQKLRRQAVDARERAAQQLAAAARSSAKAEAERKKLADHPNADWQYAEARKAEIEKAERSARASRTEAEQLEKGAAKAEAMADRVATGTAPMDAAVAARA